MLLPWIPRSSGRRVQKRVAETDDLGLRAPRRNGADTVFMSEHEIERAYAARFARRDAWADDMQALFDATVRTPSRDSVVRGILVDLGGWTDESGAATGWPVGEPFHTIARAVEWFIDDGVALATAHAEALGIDSPLRLTASIVGKDDTPLVIREEHLVFGREWRMADASASRPIFGFAPVEAPMTAHADSVERLEVAEVLALDLLNQAGIEDLKALGRNLQS